MTNLSVSQIYPAGTYRPSQTGPKFPKGVFAKILGKKKKKKEWTKTVANLINVREKNNNKRIFCMKK
jgi:hypothetical protein